MSLRDFVSVSEVNILEPTTRTECKTLGCADLRVGARTPPPFLFLGGVSHVNKNSVDEFSGFG